MRDNLPDLLFILLCLWLVHQTWKAFPPWEYRYEYVYKITYTDGTVEMDAVVRMDLDDPSYAGSLYREMMKRYAYYKNKQGALPVYSLMGKRGRGLLRPFYTEWGNGIPLDNWRTIMDEQRKNTP